VSRVQGGAEAGLAFVCESFKETRAGFLKFQVRAGGINELTHFQSSITDWDTELGLFKRLVKLLHLFFSEKSAGDPL
jgi:hypothetical protein